MIIRKEDYKNTLQLANWKRGMNEGKTIKWNGEMAEKAIRECCTRHLACKLAGSLEVCNAFCTLDMGKCMLHAANDSTMCELWQEDAKMKKAKMENWKAKGTRQALTIWTALNYACKKPQEQRQRPWRRRNASKLQGKIVIVEADTTCFNLTRHDATRRDAFKLARRPPGVKFPIVWSINCPCLCNIMIRGALEGKIYDKINNLTAAKRTWSNSF